MSFKDASGRPAQAGKPHEASGRPLGGFNCGRPRGNRLCVPLVDRMNRNMESVMTILTPVALLSIAPVLFFSYNQHPRTFYLTLTGSSLFIVALMVTMLVEVPIVKQIAT
jgi:hypothetical protein